VPRRSGVKAQITYFRSRGILMLRGARQAFIGRQLNERFRIELEAGAGGYDELYPGRNRAL
jgi:hypothetical protein